MKEHRHPHPHIDPRQPRNHTRPGVNPPLLAWKPIEGEHRFGLTIARDAACKDVLTDLQDLAEPMHLPEKAFPPGRYYWKWSTGGRESEVFVFEITPEAVVSEIPPAGQWLGAFPQGHPRIYVRPEDVPALRESRHNRRGELWKKLRARADEILAEDHHIQEPPFLPDRRVDYRRNFEVWYGVMQESRRFVHAAETLALAYLASGETKYARAACGRMDSICHWDPAGSSHIDHNDEAHMSVIWHGPQACDWVWDQFTDEQRRRVVEQFRRRGQINYDYMHGRGMYGVTRFDSHAGREIVFLAQIAFVFHEHIPEAVTWLTWLRPVLCGVWPIWAGDDGGWAEGPSYATAYVEIMTMFATALKAGAGIDLYRRPFWKNHARWRQWCLPAYAEWVGFGDNGLRPPLEANADLVETIGRQAGSGEFAAYVAACRRAISAAGGADANVHPQKYLAPEAAADAARAQRPAAGEALCRVFPHAGLAAIRTHLDDPARDVAFLFRSSPLGSVSHSHASNNDFIVHVAGKAMAMPSGYYDGYGSSHHIHWVWQTKAHNCLTLSDAGQIVHSHDSLGAVEAALENESLVYFRGNADASYPQAERCRRHVLFLKSQSCFVLIDEFVARAGVASGVQWNLHSFDPIAVDEHRRSFLIERDGSSLAGHILHHGNAFFSLSAGWDPPPMPSRGLTTRPQQHHLRFNVSGLPSRLNLGVVLCCGHAGLTRAEVAAERAGASELARIGDDVVLVNQGGTIEHEHLRSQALAVLIVGGRTYELTDESLREAPPA